MDYDGSQTNFESSMNYTLEEHANDVVYHIQSVCDEAGIPHPTIVSESGRAVVAYQRPRVQRAGHRGSARSRSHEPNGKPLHDLIETYNVTARNAPRRSTTRSRRWTWR